jgi:sorbitol/mannitol transport system permease protein
VAPSVILLFVWMAVPLAMTLYFSTLRYNLLAPGTESFVGLENYYWFLTDPAFSTALGNTLILVGSVLLITIVGGTLFGLLLDQQVVGLTVVRLMVIAPFFVMPTVSALVWKNLLMHPVSGLFAWIANSLGLKPIDWFAEVPLFSVILIVAWQWLPFATLIILTQTIFLLTVFAEILVTTGGGPGLQTTNLAFLIYAQALLQYDVGGASAGGIVAVILANIVAFFLVRLVGKNLEA